MTSTDRVEEIFQDARELQTDALEMLAQGKVPNAAEKALGSYEACHRGIDPVPDGRGPPTAHGSRQSCVRWGERTNSSRP